MTKLILTFRQDVYAETALRSLGFKNEAEELHNLPNIKNFIKQINPTAVEALKLPLIIGRSNEANFITSNAHTSVSRIHAEIYQEGKTIKIKDLGSRYGTVIVRGKHAFVVTKNGLQLEDKDIIRLGSGVEIVVSL